MFNHVLEFYFSDFRREVVVVAREDFFVSSFEGFCKGPFGIEFGVEFCRGFGNLAWVGCILYFAIFFSFGNDVREVVFFGVGVLPEVLVEFGSSVCSLFLELFYAFLDLVD